METLDTTIRLRPLRIAFLVNPTNRQMLDVVMRLATCMWGGAYCPIIPVMSRLPKAWRDVTKVSPRNITFGYLKFFEPDVFVETEDGQFDAVGFDKNRRRFMADNRFVSIHDIWHQRPNCEMDLQLGINIINIYEHLFKSEFQFEKRYKPNILRFLEGDTSSSAFFVASFGSFPTDKKLEYIPRAYEEALGARPVTPDIDAWRQIVKGQAGWPLYYTFRGLKIHQSGDWDRCIFVYDPLSGPDVIDAWTLRQINKGLVPVNYYWIEQSRQTIAELIGEHFRPMPGNPNGLMLRTRVMISRSLSAEDVLSKLNLEQLNVPNDSFVVQTWFPRIWEQPSHAISSRYSPVTLQADERDVQLSLDTKSFASLRYPALNPPFDADYVSGPGWVNTLSIRHYGGANLIAGATPSSCLEALGDHMIWGDPVFKSREGKVYFHSYRQDIGWASVSRPMEEIRGWLTSRGIDATPSEPGRIADQILSSVEGIPGTHLIAEAETVRLLDGMARSRTVWPDGSSEGFPDRTAPVHKLVELVGKIKKRDPSRNIDVESFVKCGVLRLGLSVKCTYCEYENWYSLDDVGSTLRCERCLKAFQYPQGMPQTRNMWKYRVVGPFSTPQFAHGAYSVVLTLRCLHFVNGIMPNITFSTNLLLKHEGGLVETDFFMWHKRDNYSNTPSEPELLVGECKSFGVDTFKTDDIDRLKQLGTLFPGCFLVASTLKETLSRDEVRRLRALSKWGWGKGTPLIVLTGSELFFGHRVMDVWRDLGGKRAEIANERRDVGDFETLAEVTQQAYLDLSRQDIYGFRHGPNRR